MSTARAETERVVLKARRQTSLAGALSRYPSCYPWSIFGWCPSDKKGAKRLILLGGRTRTRTLDPLIKSQLSPPDTTRQIRSLATREMPVILGLLSSSRELSATRPDTTRHSVW